MEEATPSQELPLELSPTYGVELLYDQAPQISKEALLERLRECIGRAELSDRGDEPDVLLFALPDYPIQYGDRVVPAHAFLALSDRPPDLDQLDPALQQSWNWPEAPEVVARTRATLLVSDFLAMGLDYPERLELFHNVLFAVLLLAPPQAIYWRPSQQVVDPEVYLAARQEDDPDPLFPAVNVRLFRVENGRPGELLMDTFGLGAFGLPDVQCHFLGLEPGEIANKLYATAGYLFEHGDIINDGETTGRDDCERWVCQHEPALIPPARVVLDLNPGPPFAAGERE